MSQSDQVIESMVRSVMALGATVEYAEKFRETLYALTKLSVAEHAHDVAAAAGKIKH